MNYEKKYKEALERARVYHTGGSISDAHITEVIFPELKESEDEQSKKWILEYLHDGLRKSDEQFKGQFKTAIAWLEKQDENNPTDKVEPKFKVGDWVVLTVGELSTTLQIVNVDTNKRLYWFNDSSYLPIVDEECLHHWTIKDAKDGDVLYLQHEGVEHIIIYKRLFKKNFHTILSVRCAYDGSTNDFFEDVDYYHCITSERDEKEIYPATKEQRDLLFSKMKEAGYEWDGNKKELKKIEPKKLDHDKVIEWLNNQACLGWIEDVEVVDKFKKDFGL